MDIFAHALWSGAIYNKKRVWWAVFFGIAPDLFSFGVFIVAHVLTSGFTPIAFDHGDVPRPELVPQYVHALYNVSHSLIVWAVLFAIGWFYFQRLPWEFTAWGLHILIDIPTHSTAFFPTPFLWPLPQPFFVNGVSWATPWFMLINYGAIAVVYGALYWQHARKKKVSSAA
ncbi:MAG: hypothetical protein HYT40_01725 [Candidatus Sungbacteria bacterium]|uniref:Uncharacterized protein n=1 Tax=Candidatus Sungiibacteriota bacterium TaxID=2750080 RepID=A0A931SBI3_9BACT|nr:hypothetical protein [Candidatus Sungbacteria bacterium]